MKHLLAAALACGISGTVHAAKPNIVFVLADDMGYGDVSSYNPGSHVQTVHMDALAAAGMRFTNAHTASGVCSPTRYSIMTGNHPFRVNLHKRVQFDYGDSWLPAGSPRTVADFLKTQGYQTGYIGKWHLGYHVFKSDGSAFGRKVTTVKSPAPDWSKGLRNHPFDRGFDYAFGHVASADISPYKYYYNGTWSNLGSRWVSGTSGALAMGVADAPFDGTGIKTLRAGWMDTDWHFNQVQRRLRDSALAYIDAKAGGADPFFLFVGLSAPHTPNTPHKDYQRSTPHNYTDYVKEVDEIVGSLTAKLAEKGVLGNTLFIVTSDNGANATSANIGTHRGTGVINGKNLRGQKGDAWEGGHRVPYIARWGDGTLAGSTIKPGTVNNELINLQDFFRTTAAIVQAPLGDNEAVDSWNMLPTYLGDGSDMRLREAQFSTSKGDAFAITQHAANGSKWKLIFCSGSGGGFSSPAGSIISPNQAFSKLARSKMQLFNMGTNPHESTNLLSNGTSSSERAKLKELHALMRKYMTTGRSNAGTLSTTLGLAKTAATVGVTLPNSLDAWQEPGSSAITVRLGNDLMEGIRLELRDLQGALIYQERVGNIRGTFHVKVPGNRKGMHIVRLSSGSATLLQKRLLLL